MSSVVTEIMIFQDDELEEPLQKLKMGKLRVYMCMYCVYAHPCSSTPHTHIPQCVLYCILLVVYIYCYVHVQIRQLFTYTAVEESMPAQIAEYEEAKRTESVSSATDRVSVHVHVR